LVSYKLERRQIKNFQIKNLSNVTDSIVLERKPNCESSFNNKMLKEIRKCEENMEIL
jgi:hypothetical protein